MSDVKSLLTAYKKPVQVPPHQELRILANQVLTRLDEVVNSYEISSNYTEGMNSENLSFSEIIDDTIYYTGETWAMGGCATYSLRLPLTFLTDTEEAFENYAKYRDIVKVNNKSYERLSVINAQISSLKGLIRTFGEELPGASVLGKLAAERKDLEAQREVTLAKAADLRQYSIDLRDC